MTTRKSWINFGRNLAKTPSLDGGGGRKIFRNLPFYLPKIDNTLKLDLVGYKGQGNKMTQLKRYYLDSEELSRCKQGLDYIIGKNQYGSYSMVMRNEPKNFTKQDYCMQNLVFTYLPKKESLFLNVTWRTAEYCKVFVGDLIFLRDEILPHFPEVRGVECYFINLTLHSQYYPIILSQLKSVKRDIEAIKKSDYDFYKNLMRWCRYYIEEDTNYSQAKVVKDILEERLKPRNLKALKGAINEWKNL